MPEVGPEGVQVCTGTLGLLLTLQVTFPAATHVATAAELEVVPQVVCCHPLPAVAVTGVQEPTTVGPVTTLGQVVVTQLLPDVPALATQLPLAVGPEVAVWQVVAVQLLPLLAPAGVQLLTG